MNILRRNLFIQSKKSWQRNIHQIYAEPLPNRSLVKLSGTDNAAHLQALSTNDVGLFDKSKSMFCMFLNADGRTLLDALVYKYNNDLIIECDSSISEYLCKHLKIYKLRKKVDIAIIKELQPWVIYNVDGDQLKEESVLSNLQNISNNIQVYMDPRLKELGFRALIPPGVTLTETEKFQIKTDSYRKFRYKLGIGEGSSDIIYNKTFPLEANCDILNGVSFGKGCYIGQELTARVHHTGVIRKRYIPIRSSEKCNINLLSTITNERKKNIGKIISWEDNVGIGLMRIEDSFKAKELKVNDTTLSISRPLWWPEDVSKNI